jgi:hypothetical protein
MNTTTKEPTTMQTQTHQTVAELQARIGTRVRYSDFTGSMDGKIVSVQIIPTGIRYEIAWDNCVAGTAVCDLSQAGWSQIEPERKLSAYAQVLADAIADGTVAEEDADYLSTNMQRAVNMTGGRHSDAMRSEVFAYRSQGRDAYIADFDRVRQ